jgi:glycosyltransferase involved in cell wall biosynthesis
MMNYKPSFSIVTPSFNQRAFIGEALLSVKNQEYNKVEHLVIDGGSQDDTAAILHQYANQKCWSHLYWVSEPDRGQSDALNKGFSRVTGDIVGWLNSDDRYRPGCFEYVAEVFAQHPEVDVVYGDYTWIDEAGRVSSIRREIEFNPFILLYHRVLYIPTTATFFRRRIFAEGNRLDERLHYAMDFEFFVRLATDGYRFKHVPAILADFRFQEGSKTCTASHKQLEELNAVMHLYSPVLRKIQRPAPRRIATSVLRSCASVLRYSEKLMRGYYFDQYRPATLGS